MVIALAAGLVPGAGPAAFSTQVEPGLDLSGRMRARLFDFFASYPDAIETARAVVSAIGYDVRLLAIDAQGFDPVVTRQTITSPVADRLQREHSGELAALLRDIFGNPFHPASPLPPAVLAWNEGVVVKLARAAYDDRALPAGALRPDRLAVLADALEEAGCTDAELLTHLRVPGTHVRACAAVDAVLGCA